LIPSSARGIDGGPRRFTEVLLNQHSLPAQQIRQERKHALTESLQHASAVRDQDEPEGRCVVPAAVKSWPCRRDCHNWHASRWGTGLVWTGTVSARRWGAQGFRISRLAAAGAAYGSGRM